jgi:hypothetical protein
VSDLIAVSCGTWYDHQESQDTVHVFEMPTLAEVFSSEVGEKGYGVNPGNVLSFGGENDEFLICGGSPITLWKKREPTWEERHSITNDFGLITGASWSTYLNGFVLTFASNSSGGFIILRLSDNGLQIEHLEHERGVSALGLSECGQFIAWGDFKNFCYLCRFEDDGRLAILGATFVQNASSVTSAVVSHTSNIVAFGDSNGDIHAFRFIA